MNMLAELEHAAVAEQTVTRFITAGSPGAGRRTLISRLLQDAETLPGNRVDEARRSAGEFRALSTARGKFVIADMPSHQQYTRNMESATSRVDAAVIVIDANQGLLPQTSHHLLLAHYLGVRNIIVAVNKLDLAGYEYVVFKAIRQTVEEFAKPLGLPSLSFIPTSALHGDNVVEPGANLEWYQGPTLLQKLGEVATQG